jgi:large subunit ribosomal protein L24
MKLHVKKGDNVKVLSGDDKNQNGVVTKVYPKKGTAIVEGINIVKKHVKKKTE